MTDSTKSAGDFLRDDSSVAAIPGSARASVTTLCALPQRDPSVTVRKLVDLYMAQYAGRDTSRPQRLAFWTATIGDVRLDELDDDRIHQALEQLAQQRGRYWAGKDADGRAIYRGKSRPLTGATINRYKAALGALLSWCVRKRIAPKGWTNPSKGIESQPESRGVVRFLDDRERKALLAACRKSRWPKLYAFVLLLLTSGCRRGEAEGLRWGDVDLEAGVAHVAVTKNADSRVLVLVPAVVAELGKFVGARDTLVFASIRRPAQPYNMVPVWQAALREAKVRNFRMHDLRHTCASYLAQSGATLLEIADALGHRQLSVTQRYSHLTVKHRAALIAKVMGDKE